MAQRVFNLSKWTYLAEGLSIAFDKPEQRMVTLEVNCPAETAFYVVEDREDLEQDPERISDKEAGRPVIPVVAIATKDRPKKEAVSDRMSAVTFLGLAKGRDRFEFGVEGPFELLCEGSGAYIYTPDSTDVSTHIVAPVIFTKIANRRARNPQLELIEYQMRLNQERFRAQLEDESNRRIEALEKRLESYAPERNKGTPLERPGRQQSPEGSGSNPPAAPVGKAGEDEAESKGGGAGTKKRKAAGADDDPGSLI